MHSATTESGSLHGPGRFDLGPFPARHGQLAQRQGAGARLQAHKTVKPVNFRYIGVTAKSVSIVGDFNEWRPEATPMTRHYDGSWQIQVPLNHGHHQYAFIVDGQLIQDSRAFGAARNAAGQKVSLIAVS